MMYTLFYSVFVPVLLVTSRLLAIGIDVSDENLCATIRLDRPGTFVLELSHFQADMIYVFQFSGIRALEVINACDAVTVSPKNNLLIENEEQLGDSDTLYVRVTPKPGRTSVRIIKRVASTSRFQHLGNGRWGAFIDAVRECNTPGAAALQLAEMADEVPQRVFTVGCETGKDPLFWASRGASLELLDGTPHAVAVTALRLADQGALDQARGLFPCLLEGLPEGLGPFDAVTGTAVFPFVPPAQFSKVMREGLFALLAPGGYFAGHFFGNDHGWSDREELTFVSVDELLGLVLESSLEVLWLEEVNQDAETLFDGLVHWHEIRLIARKPLSPEALRSFPKPHGKGMTFCA